VTPFSRWERELPKLAADSRYKAVANPKDRKAMFDEYCRSAAASKPSGNKAATQDADEKASGQEAKPLQQDAGGNGSKADSKKQAKENDDKAKFDFKCVTSQCKNVRQQAELKLVIIFRYYFVRLCSVSNPYLDRPATISFWGRLTVV
jgi:hypothetical protein